MEAVDGLHDYRAPGVEAAFTWTRRAARIRGSSGAPPIRRPLHLTNPDTPTRLDNLASHLGPGDFSRRACGIGAKGFHTYDWAVIAGQDGRQYVVRRSIADGEIAYFHCYNPRGESLSELVAVIGLRWPVEECLCATRRSAVSPAQPGGIGGRFLGSMAYLTPKGL